MSRVLLGVGVSELARTDEDDIEALGNEECGEAVPERVKGEPSPAR